MILFFFFSVEVLFRGKKGSRLPLSLEKNVHVQLYMTDVTSEVHHLKFLIRFCQVYLYQSFICILQTNTEPSPIRMGKCFDLKRKKIEVNELSLSTNSFQVFFELWIIHLKSFYFVCRKNPKTTPFPLLENIRKSCLLSIRCTCQLEIYSWIIIFFVFF